MRREWIEIISMLRSARRKMSPSMRREWIEMPSPRASASASAVSLHAEGVD